jgi:hypothetical protein
MSILRLITLAISGLGGIFAAMKPQHASIIIPVATALAGWATPHPSDKAKKDE